MNLEETYRLILKELASGGRGLRKLGAMEVSTLQAALGGSNFQQRSYALLVVAHSAFPCLEFEEKLLPLMKENLSSEDLIWLLSAVRKHVLLGRFRQGERLPFGLFENLKQLLGHKDKSVVEWNLRTIEECGTQAILLRPDLQRIKPPWWSLWRAENRTILELITFIERKWTPVKTAK